MFDLFMKSVRTRVSRAPNYERQEARHWYCNSTKGMAVTVYMARGQFILDSLYIIYQYLQLEFSANRAPARHKRLGIIGYASL